MKKNKIKLDIKGASIGKKLISALISLCIIPLLALGMFSYYRSYATMSGRFEITTEQTLGEVNRGIDNYFEGIGRQLNMLSTNIDLTDIQSNPEYEPFLKYLINNVKESNEEVSLLFYGTSNKKIYTSPEANVGADFDPTTRPWYSEAVQNKGEITISKPYKDAVTGKLVVSISKTVEKNGVIVGVVGMDLSLEHLSNNLSNIKVGKEGYVYIFDTTGIVLAHPKKEVIGTNDPTKLSFWEDAQKNAKGFEEYTYNGVKKYGVFATNSETGWKIMATMDRNELTRDTAAIRNTTIIFILLAGIVAVILSIIISKWITNTIKKLTSVFSKASNGDLTVRVDINSKDEFGELGNDFNMMLESIGGLIKELKESSMVILQTSETIGKMSEQTNVAVGEVASAIDAVALGTSDQTKNIEEGVHELEGLANRIENITDLTGQMIEISRDTDSLSKDGLNIVETLLDKSNKTSESASAVGDVVLDMNRATDEIGLITDTINQISAQTNLLALNAAIEAARAGESGRGFAVVADEVRKLAEQSTESTKKIQQLIEMIKEKSQMAVKAVDEAKSIIGEQGEVVVETKSTFTEILSSIRELTKQIDGVQQSIEDTNSNKDEIIGRMQNISAVSEETSASTEEVSASAEEITATMDELNNYAGDLKNLANKLQEEINKFEV